MTTKNIYFLRHGQTELNKSWVHQFPDTRLSKKGENQARAIAKQLKDVPIDVIVCSTLERTRQTAQIVAEAIQKPIEHSELFVELRRPRELWGVSWLTFKSLWAMGMLYFKAGKPSWHYSDEENLEEFRARARRGLEHLADRQEQNILVVTHRGLMSGLAGRIKHDGEGSIRQYRRALWKNLKIGNCCYISTTWSPKGKNGDSLDGTWTLKKGTKCPLSS